MDIDLSWFEDSPVDRLESDDEDDLIFSRIDMDSFCEPAETKLIHLDCNQDCSNYNEWTGGKSFAKVFSPVEESSLYDADLLSDLFLIAKQTIVELKLQAPKDQLEKRLAVTNLLHFTYSELRNVDATNLDLITSLLDHKQFSPTPQDSSNYLHGYLEWKYILALIAQKMEKGISAIQQLCLELISYSIGTMGDSDILHISPFPCRCFENLWKLIMSLTEQLPQTLNIWALIDESIQTVHSSSSLNFMGNSKKYRDDRLTSLWFLRHFVRCMTWDQESRIAEYREMVAKVMAAFLDRDPPEADLRVAKHELKIIGRSHELSVDLVVQLWDSVYKRINTNFKSINLDTTNSLLVPNESAMSYISKVTQLISSPDSSNPTSYDLFLEVLVQAWKKADQDVDVKYQQKLTNRILLKFSTKIWLTMNEMGIHNLINVLLVLYCLGGDDRTLDRVEIVFLSVPFSEITHNRRLCVFKGLLSILILFYGQPERKTKNFPENFMKKFENAVGVDRLTGRQMVTAMDTIMSASEALNNKEHVIINPWIRSYLNVCSESDRDVILETMTRIMEKYSRLKSENSGCSEEVIKRIYQALEGLLVGYLNAEQEIEISHFIANLFLCLRTPIQGIPLVDTLFANLILNNVKHPRIQLKICKALADFTGHQSIIHVNNLIKAFIKFILIIDGPSTDLKPLLLMIGETREFKSFSSMDQEDFLSSPQPFQVFLKGIRTGFNALSTDAERDRFSHKFEMYFQMYTKWYLPHIKSAEDALKCYTNTTAMIFNCGKIMYPKRNPNMLKTIISDFYLTSSLLLGKNAQPAVVVKAMSKVLHKLLEGLFHMERATTQPDEYLSSVISDLIFHWPLQFSPELGVTGATAPFVKFAKTNNVQVNSVFYEKFCKILLTSQSQRDILSMTMLKELVNRLKDDTRQVTVLLEGVLHHILEYYCKCEDFAPVKKNIIEFLEEISTLSFVSENMEISRVIDGVLEEWATRMLVVNSSNFFELAIKLARLFPVNLRLIMPKLRAEISTHSGGQFGSYDRLQIKLKNLESILNQK